MRKYSYYKSCVDFGPLDVWWLNEMIDDERTIDITLRTFKAHCAGVDEWATHQGYELDKRRGLTMANDYAISFHRSYFRGVRCYYIKWSAIEFIWRKTELER